MKHSCLLIATAPVSKKGRLGKIGTFVNHIYAILLLVLFVCVWVIYSHKFDRFDMDYVQVMSYVLGLLQYVVEIEKCVRCSHFGL